MIIQPKSITCDSGITYNTAGNLLSKDRGRYTPMRTKSASYIILVHSDGRLYIAKKINPKNRKYFETERSVLRALRGIDGISHIVDENDQRSILVCEFGSGGDLGSLLSRFHSRSSATQVLAYVAGSMAQVHERGYIHRDLKLDNFVLSAEGRDALRNLAVLRPQDVSIIDFGISINGEETSDFLFGTAEYMSPEAFNGFYTKKGDVYALGVAGYRMIKRREPFIKGLFEDSRTFRARIASTPIPNLEPTDDLSTLILEMLAKEPDNRPSMQEVSQRTSLLMQQAS